jgi:sulfate adenylyltransferase subunit 2
LKHTISAGLSGLIDESIFIIREASACERPAILFSGGKDSAVVAWLARLAFAPAPVPMPLLHIDTGHNYKEVIQFRDAFSQTYSFSLVVGHVEDSISRGTVRLASAAASRNEAQAVTLLEAIEQHRFGALLGGARRDEEKARAKERIFSHRNSFGNWDPKKQRPELWDLFNTHTPAGDHLRVFPISNWTEVDVWEFIASQNIPLPSLYYAHQREVVTRQGLLIPKTELTLFRTDETPVVKTVRFRTVGDMSCTCPITSDAANAWQVLDETRTVTVSERGATRMDDQISEFAMEQRKRQGYF